MDDSEEGIEAEPGDNEMDSLVRQIVHLRVDEYPEPPSPGPDNAAATAAQIKLGVLLLKHRGCLVVSCMVTN